MTDWIWQQLWAEKFSHTGPAVAAGPVDTAHLFTVEALASHLSAGSLLWVETY